MDREERKPGPNSPLSHISRENGSELRSNEISLSRSKIVKEVKKQLWLSGPLFMVSFLRYCLLLISLIFVGHLGNLALAGASMANSFASVTGFTLQRGMASALETLCGQSNGAKQYHMLGVHLQRAMFVLSLVSIPIALIWAYMGQILLAARQDPDISSEAGIYAPYLIPGLFAFGLLQCEVRFLQTQNIVFPMMISFGITALLHILICWILVFKAGLGNRGAALANSISYWINVLFIAIYIKFSPSCKRTWTGFSKEALRGVINFLRLGIPSALMLCLGVWCYEMIVLLSGLLPNPKLETSVLSICLNTAAMVRMIANGLGAAVSTRVSNELGAENPQAARLAVRVVFLMTITQGILVGLTMISVRRVWGYVYSNDEEVIRYVAYMLPVLAASNFLDGIQNVLSGTVRGRGRQKIGAFINLGAYYLVGIPFAILFAFVFHMRGKGLWLGIICALFVQVFLLSILTLRCNWEKEAKKATDRVHNSTIPVNMASGS